VGQCNSGRCNQQYRKLISTETLPQARVFSRQEHKDKEITESLCIYPQAILCCKMSSSKIVVLASSIEKNTRIVDDFLRKNDLPTPTFDSSYPPDLPLPPNITNAKQDVLEAMDELEALLLGPMPKIFNDLVVRVSRHLG
jgi:hypothetical protein